MNPDKVVFTKKKDGTYYIETTHDYPDRTSVDSYEYCEVIWKDPERGVPESVSILSDWGTSSMYYKTKEGND